MVEGVEVQRRESELVCAYCREAVAADDEVSSTCAGCEAVYHWPCVAELGRCGTIGCDGGRAAARVARKARMAFLAGSVVTLVAVLVGLWSTAHR